ncbi:adenylate kinase [Planosporangium flavigriseum]|uniref:adenylate kinase n=1 Tax=Planosporangium flavigriseum TaxID=373681 RepID=UPI001438885A|nr:adenylate kinase [Planosporangium flavigriseum]NJC67085.1 adenylate kinase [Planosporangium flavigriseum]
MTRPIGARQLPINQRRILIVGISGAGKTTLGLRLAAILRIPFFEVDSLFYGPNWTRREDFPAKVAEIAGQERWIVDSFGYCEVQSVLAPKADLILWLDYSRALVMRRVLSRSLRRALRGEVRRDGNVERFRDWLRADFPVRWAWQHHHDRRRFFLNFLRDYASQGKVIRLRTPSQAECWVIGR